MLWETYVQDRVRASNGWFYLNPAIAKQAASFEGGVYIYTDRYRWNTNNRYKVGLTRRNERRLFEQGADRDEDLYIIGFINMDLDGLGDYDKRVHRLLERDQDCKIVFKESSPNPTEWVEFPENVDPVGLVTYVIQQDQDDDTIGRIHLELTLSQYNALEDALKQYEHDNGLLADLCARFGKTPWGLVIFDHFEEDVMVICSYVLSALRSFRNDVARFYEFQDMCIANSKEEIEQNRQEGKKSLVLVGLHESFNAWKKKYGWIQNVDNRWVFVDEADYGAHQPKQVKKVKFLYECP